MLEMTLWVILLVISSFGFGILPILSILQSKFVPFVLKDANNELPEIYVVHEDQLSNSRVVKSPAIVTSIYLVSVVLLTSLTLHIPRYMTQFGSHLTHIHCCVGF